MYTCLQLHTEKLNATYGCSYSAVKYSRVCTHYTKQYSAILCQVNHCKLGYSRKVLLYFLSTQITLEILSTINTEEFTKYKLQSKLTNKVIAIAYILPLQLDLEKKKQLT